MIELIWISFFEGVIFFEFLESESIICFFKKSLSN